MVYIKGQFQIRQSGTWIRSPIPTPDINPLHSHFLASEHHQDFAFYSKSISDSAFYSTWRYAGVDNLVLPPSATMLVLNGFISSHGLASGYLIGGDVCYQSS